MIIKVTQEHINKGERNKYSKCPIALALRDATGYPYPGVGSDKLWWAPKGEYYQSEVIQTWRISFDEGEAVEPFEFETEYLNKVP